MPTSHQSLPFLSKMRDKLEDKLLRAKRHRSEFLCQRRRQRDSISLYCDMMQQDGDLLSRKLSRCWKCFVSQKKTTLDLAEYYDALKINESLPFELLALPPQGKRRRQVLVRIRKGKRVTPGRRVAVTSVKMSKFPVRVVLSAFMIFGHPDAMFNSQSDQEAALNDSTKGFVREFKLLIKVIKEGPVKMYVGESKLRTLRSQLDLFDKAWCAFMNSFVLWKVKDARLLGEDKVRAVCQLEISMIQKCKITPEGDDTVLIHDRKRFRPEIQKALLSFPVLPLLSFPGITKGYTNFSLL
ncbi:hypothetical protein HID58_075173 [Brassica napus]|uniref:Uncharacterized protein n=2 Tax=Brassica TaxID=3705 RepID=A0ABQ7YLW7_BRANA|nr:hypothetical protein HID58_075173 [Brassica napus]